MNSAIGCLKVVIGLPGAGKSTLIRRKLRQTVTGLCIEDFHGNAFDDSPDVKKSRHFVALLEAIKAGHTCIIADIEFCRPSRRDAVVRILLAEIPLLRIEYHCFRNQPGRCIENAKVRNRVGVQDECRKIEALSQEYVLPLGAIEYDVMNDWGVQT